MIWHTGIQHAARGKSCSAELTTHGYHSGGGTEGRELLLLEGATLKIKRRVRQEWTSMCQKQFETLSPEG